MDWWITQGGRKPIGPVSTDLVLRGLDAGKVPEDSLVCQVGGTQWLALSEVAEFASKLASLKGRPRFDTLTEQTLVDLGPDSYGNDGPEERTIVDTNPIRPSEPPPGRATIPGSLPDADLEDDDGEEEQTAVGLKRMSDD